MTNAWMRLHECNAAADAALSAATDALGSDGFPLLLVEYQRAMEQAAAMRMALRTDLAEGAADPVADARQRRAGSAAGT